MPDESSPVALMQSALGRASEVLRESALKARIELVDRPFDGRELSTTERRENYKMHRDNSSMIAAKAAELRQKYKVRPGRGSIRLLEWIEWHEADLGRTEKEDK